MRTPRHVQQEWKACVNWFWRARTTTLKFELRIKWSQKLHCTDPERALFHTIILTVTLHDKLLTHCLVLANTKDPD